MTNELKSLFNQNVNGNLNQKSVKTLWPEDISLAKGEIIIRAILNYLCVETLTRRL